MKSVAELLSSEPKNTRPFAGRLRIEESLSHRLLAQSKNSISKLFTYRLSRKLWPVGAKRAGKTTLLKLLLNCVPPLQGLLLGSLGRSRRERVGYLPENPLFL